MLSASSELRVLPCRLLRLMFPLPNHGTALGQQGLPAAALPCSGPSSPGIAICLQRIAPSQLCSVLASAPVLSHRMLTFLRAAWLEADKPHES